MTCQDASMEVLSHPIPAFVVSIRAILESDSDESESGDELNEEPIKIGNENDFFSESSSSSNIEQAKTKLPAHKNSRLILTESDDADSNFSTKNKMTSHKSRGFERISRQMKLVLDPSLEEISQKVLKTMSDMAFGSISYLQQIDDRIEKLAESMGLVDELERNEAINDAKKRNWLLQFAQIRYINRFSFFSFSFSLCL